MKPRLFTIPKVAQYSFFIYEAQAYKPQATVEIRKTDYTLSGCDRFSIVTDIQEFDSLIPLLKARKEELVKTAHKTKTLRGDPYASPNADSRMIKVDKAERVFNRELLDIQAILYSYNRVKRGELHLKQEI